MIASALVLAGAALAWSAIDPQAARPVPDLTLRTYGGTLYRLGELRQKVLVINFWASWCAPCRAEAPTLQRLWLDLQARGVVFLGVDQADTTDHALAFLREFGVSYPNGPDDGFVQAFGVQSLPTTILVDRNGLIRDTLYTAVVEMDSLRARIEALLQ